jgi:hypothetical protein
MAREQLDAQAVPFPLAAYYDPRVSRSGRTILLSVPVVDERDPGTEHGLDLVAERLARDESAPLWSLIERRL